MLLITTLVFRLAFSTLSVVFSFSVFFSVFVELFESVLLCLSPSDLLVESLSFDLLVVGLVESVVLESVSVVVVDELSARFEFAVFDEFTVVFAVFTAVSLEEPPNGQPIIKKLENIKIANAFFISFKTPSGKTIVKRFAARVNVKLSEQPA